MFAGSLRTIELMQEQFEQENAAFTAVSGLSWGGITSLLYEAVFQRARAVIPLFASPNLAQVFSDAAGLFGRPLPIPRTDLDDLLDFTPYYERCDKDRVFPVLGEDDLFFRFDQHAVVYPPETLVALPSTHVGALWRNEKAPAASYYRDIGLGSTAPAPIHFVLRSVDVHICTITQRVPALDQSAFNAGCCHHRNLAIRPCPRFRLLQRRSYRSFRLDGVAHLPRFLHKFSRIWLLSPRRFRDPQDFGHLGRHLRAPLSMASCCS